MSRSQTSELSLTGPFNGWIEVGSSDFFQRTEAAKKRKLEPAIDTSAFVVGLLGAVLHQSKHASAQRRDEVGS